ncbi:MAG TPA: FAD-dependent oxidoreductase [Acidimicrobiia bacterium]|nr:FAD-dependent oxidoreductase [Acidimicrobiia bacterium]
MTQRATTVVLGAGIVGASVAYHLAQLGHDDILVVDQGDIPHNPGSTSHAPGGVVAMSHDRLLARMSFYSTDLYRRLERYDDFRHTYNPVGSIELARTADRMADLVREHGEALAFGAATALQTPNDIAEKVPYLDPGPMAGGLFIPDSAIISGANVTGALLRDAELSGRVTTKAHTTVIDIEVADDRLTAVLTDDGERIETERVVLCTNIWSLPLRRRLPTLPLMAFEHQYVETSDVLEGFDPDNPDHEVTVPTVRDLDAGLYYRHHWNRIGVGSYHHAPLPVHPSDVGETAHRAFTPQHFEAAWKAACLMVPDLENSNEFSRTLNGMFAFSVDGMPIIGETNVSGLWMAVASWITHAGGVGKSLAEMVDGDDPEWDLRKASIDRFHPHERTRAFIEVVTAKNYAEVYDIHHPQEPPSRPRDLRRSPFAAVLAAHRPHNSPFGGIELASWYESNSALADSHSDRLPTRSEWASRHWSPITGAEHLACRDNAALFDLTGLSIIEVTGPAAMAYVNRLCSSRMDVPPGRVVYTTWLTPAGGLKRDLTVARLGPHRYWMFVGEGTRPQDVAWTNRHAGSHDVRITDISDAYTALGLWGPNAPRILEAAAGQNPGLGYFRGTWIEIGPVPVYAMRISYVGEAGYELHLPVDQAVTVFDRLWDEGAAGSLVMAGSAAMDSLRIEKGYRLWGADIDTEYDPYEAGLGWTVHRDKADFIGAAACRERADREPARRLTCLLLEAGDPLGNEAVLSDGEAVGYVTSAAHGYSIGAPIAYTYLPPALATPGTGVGVLVEGTEHPARVVTDPLWDPGGDRLR